MLSYVTSTLPHILWQTNSRLFCKYLLSLIIHSVLLLCRVGPHWRRSDSVIFSKDFVNNQISVTAGIFCHLLQTQVEILLTNSFCILAVYNRCTQPQVSALQQLKWTLPTKPDLLQLYLQLSSCICLQRCHSLLFPLDEDPMFTLNMHTFTIALELR